MPKKGEAVSFEPNDLIFAKVKGYPCWPACVTQATDEKKNKYSVYFYGTYETAIVKKDEMFPFNEATKSKYGKNKKKDFGKAMEEIENTPEIGYGIPIIDSGKAPLEGGISGDTLLDDSSMETSVTEEKSPVEEEAVEENTEEPHAEEAKTEPEISEPEKPKKVEKPKAEKAAKAFKKVAEEKAEPVKTETPKPAKKGTKRKASTSNAPKETDSPLTPVVKQPKLSTSTPVSTPVNAEEKTSRSGRVIKPKKFEDEADSAKDKTVTHFSTYAFPFLLFSQGNFANFSSGFRLLLHVAHRLLRFF